MKFYYLVEITKRNPEGIVGRRIEKEYIEVSYPVSRLLEAIVRVNEWKHKYPDGATIRNIDDFVRRYTHICHVGWDTKSDWIFGHQVCDGLGDVIEEAIAKGLVRYENDRLKLLVFWEE